MVRGHAVLPHRRVRARFVSTHPTSWLEPLGLAVALLGFSGCAHVPPAASVTQWTYPEGPGWGSACEAPPPPQQSPITFVGVATTPWTASTVVPQATFDPHDQNVVFTASPGPSVAMTPGIGDSAKPYVYTVAGFHFHHRNEHVVDGTPVFEIHIKTTDQYGGTAVFGALWKIDDGVADDPTLVAAYRSLSAPPGSVEAVDLGSVLWRFGHESFYSYVGSLTTPPCTGNIRWFVLQAPIRTPSGIVNRLRAALRSNGMPENNVRGVKPLAQPAPTIYRVTPKQ